ncbi:hypothetical protein FTV88_1421 [Heliorestis convoluta]|uniref:Uncharacterized protein n=1 Tax=Heliorestis convoluta TaxID=356322 RepID=A0A5Q2MXZ6_9FIRM|nr:hypothetical protein FTV88_1421 [Heliorestis convoluta]
MHGAITRLGKPTAAAEMAKIMQDNLQDQLTILKSQLEGVAIEI